MKQQLVDNDTRFNKLIQHSYSGIMLLNAAFQLIYSSPSANQIYGWGNKAPLGKGVMDLVHHDDLALVSETLHQVSQKAGMSQSCTFRGRHNNQAYIWVEGTYTNMLADADVGAIVCNFRDVSVQTAATAQLTRQSRQITDVLEALTDGFISLDKNQCYTYVNAQLCKMLGRTSESLIGQHIWTVYPEAVGSVTYKAIETAIRDRIHVCNQDFLASMQLWYENRVYPTATGVSMFIRDITKQKKEEQNLKLLESVITNTTDAVLITEAEPFDEPGPRILYVNQAFTKLIGYTAEDVIGKTPRILQGPKTDKAELKRLSECMRKWQPCETTVINYKKNGDEFWLNFAISPVADENGWFTHWISIDKDITERKNEELKKKLLTDISTHFNPDHTLQQSLQRVLELLINFGEFVLAEAWLISTDKRKLKLTATCCKTPDALVFFTESRHIKSFKPGEGLPGTIWQTQTIQVWEDIDEREDFLRRDAAKIAGLKTAYGIPLFNNNDITGVLILGLSTNQHLDNVFDALIPEIALHIGTEIKRKQLEEELTQMFNQAPDVICIAGTDGYFKKVNPALCTILGHTSQELLSKPLIAFIHPDDQEKTVAEFNQLSESKRMFNFETRSISHTGKTIWLRWTSTPASEDGLLFCVARDITEQKELEVLLNKATRLAGIGSWEIDLVNNTVYWSDITKEIHGVSADYTPTVETGINFYKKGYDRETIAKKTYHLIADGTPIDTQLQIATPAGQVKWVRVIGEAEFVDGSCIKVHGSFQDIDAIKQAEIAVNKALEEKNTILESIDDAFFAVDKDWTVTYWNNKAEEVLYKQKDEMLQVNLWNVFSESVGSLSYQKYHEAVTTNQAVHFEDYYPPLKKWYDISAYPSANGLAVYFKDITERKQTDEALIDSEKRYSELFQLSPVPKWVYDIETLQFLDVNKAALKNYGYSREDFLSMTIKDIRPAEEVIKLEETLNKLKHQNHTPSSGIFIHKKKNGEEIKVDIQSNRILFKGKSAKVVIANDITERLKYVKAIEDQNKKLLEVSWMQSHVIRAPLARMMGLISLIKDADETNTEKELMIDYLLTSANELDDVIKQITDITNVSG